MDGVEAAQSVPGGEVAGVAGQGFVDRDGVQLCVSNLLGKLGLRDRVQAAICAYETGLIAPGGN